MSDVNKNDWRDFLAHYGVKGMKWGKRKKHWQNTHRDAILKTLNDVGYTNKSLRTQAKKFSDYYKPGSVNRQQSAVENMTAKNRAGTQVNVLAKQLPRTKSEKQAYLRNMSTKTRLKNISQKAKSKAKKFLAKLFKR